MVDWPPLPGPLLPDDDKQQAIAHTCSEANCLAAKMHGWLDVATAAFMNSNTTQRATIGAHMCDLMRETLWKIEELITIREGCGQAPDDFAWLIEFRDNFRKLDRLYKEAAEWGEPEDYTPEWDDDD